MRCVLVKYKKTQFLICHILFFNTIHNKEYTVTRIDNTLTLIVDVQHYLFLLKHELLSEILKVSNQIPMCHL